MADVMKEIQEQGRAILITVFAGLSSLGTSIDTSPGTCFGGDGFTGYRNVHDYAFDITTAEAPWTTENPEMAIGGGLLVASASSVLLEGSGGGNNDVGGIIVFRRKNEVPYTRIEKRADAIYHTLHKKQPQKSKAPVLLATTKDAMDGVSKLFGNGCVGEMTETLRVLEGLLEKQ